MPDDASTTGTGSVAESSDSVILLVRISAAIAGLDENSVRKIMEAAVGRVDPALVDEVILQSYLFAGFPRALNAARIWRAFMREPMPETLAESGGLEDWKERGKM